MPIGPQKMPFLSHLAELRQRILVIAVTVGVGSVIRYPFSQDLSLAVRARSLRTSSEQAVRTGPFEAFLFRFKIAFYAALVLTSPIWLYQLLAFFLPALKEKERKFFVPTFLAILVLFIGGNLFCHYVVLPASFQWLHGADHGGDRHPRCCS